MSKPKINRQWPSSRLHVFFTFSLPLSCINLREQDRWRACGTFLVFSVFFLSYCPWYLPGVWREHDGLCVTALMSCAPTQIHMAQFALIDGFFAFWATSSLWLLWENFRRPNNWGWLTCYTLSLALLVLDKRECYVCLRRVGWPAHGESLVSIWPGQPIIQYWLTFVGPLVGVVILVNLCGSLGPQSRYYSILVGESIRHCHTRSLTGDGPWYRYLGRFVLDQSGCSFWRGGAIS